MNIIAVLFQKSFIWEPTFLGRGIHVSTIGFNEAVIKKYIEEQDKNDIALDKLRVKEYELPLRDGKTGKGNRLEYSESQSFEMLIDIPRHLAFVHTTHLMGGYAFLIIP